MITKTPPMGWNSWNTFGENINEKVILETADAMVDLGYLKAGYEYLVIDDCWATFERDENGNLVPDPEKFPHGMKYVSDYVHKKGLKFGIYSAAGFRTCMGRPGSFGREFQDAKLFASWDVDYLKYDTCGFPGCATGRSAYQTMSMAIKASGRDMVYSICTVGMYDPWLWARSAGGNLYRSYCDIQDNFKSFKANAITQVTTNHMSCSASNCFNDFDMLTVGMYNKGHNDVIIGVGDCGDTEYKTQFGLWCLFGVPLMIGGDVRSFNKFSHDLLTDKDLIALNQDEETRPPYYEDKMKYANDTQMSFVRHLTNGEIALAFFNFSDEESIVMQAMADIGLPPYSKKHLLLKDLFTKEEFVMNQDLFVPKIEKHGCRIYRGKIID